ncbi:MAG: acyl-CoA dehydrogenase family protein, partial [Gammaproteobacteria bacterium]|nr:acyl-CoA dehydrogenase family protein [Gammaproteobacteria bacterium]
TASGYALNGSKAVVLGAPNADLIVVSARTSGDVRDAEGVSLFVVTPNAAGVTLTDYVTVDGGRAAEVAFENVELGADALLGEIGAASSVIERVVDEALLAVGAEAVGAMEVLYKATVEYAKQRKQFGVPIGSFQVLQHRMVDMFMAHEQAKSLMYMAAIRLDEDDAAEARKAASAFKVQVGKSGRAVGQGAVQIHGGMGMTDELNIGHYFKRLTVIETLFGNTDHHLKRFASI